jgi:hypothetical protein
VFNDNLKPGDIIATTIPDNLVSSAIRATTGSRFSHLSMYLGDRVAIEANEMVATFSLDRVGIRNIDNVRVLRLRQRHDRKRICDQAIRHAGSRVGQPYWTGGAVLSLLRVTNYDRPPGAFCSELVASAYASANCPLRSDRSPQHTTPEDVLRARDVLFFVKRDTVLSSVNLVEARGMEYLDAERSDLPPGLMLSLMELEVCNDLKGYFCDNGLPEPRSLLEAEAFVLESLRKDRERGRLLDLRLVTALRKAHYFENRATWFERESEYASGPVCEWLNGLRREDRWNAARQMTEVLADRRKRLLTHHQNWGTRAAELCQYDALSARLMQRHLTAEQSLIQAMIADEETCGRILEEYARGVEVEPVDLEEVIRRMTGALSVAEVELVVPGEYILRTPGGRIDKYEGVLRDCLLVHAARCETASASTPIESWRRDLATGALRRCPTHSSGGWLVSSPDPLGAKTVKVLGRAKFEDFWKWQPSPGLLGTKMLDDSGKFVLQIVGDDARAQIYQGYLSSCLDAYVKSVQKTDHPVALAVRVWRWDEDTGTYVNHGPPPDNTSPWTDVTPTAWPPDRLAPAAPIYLGEARDFPHHPFE